LNFRLIYIHWHTGSYNACGETGARCIFNFSSRGIDFTSAEKLFFVVRENRSGISLGVREHRSALVRASFADRAALTRRSTGTGGGLHLTLRLLIRRGKVSGPARNAYAPNHLIPAAPRTSTAEKCRKKARARALFRLPSCKATPVEEQTSPTLSFSVCFVKTAAGFSAGSRVLREIRPPPSFTPQNSKFPGDFWVKSGPGKAKHRTPSISAVGEGRRAFSLGGRHHPVINNCFFVIFLINYSPTPIGRSLLTVHPASDYSLE